MTHRFHSTAPIDSHSQHHQEPEQEKPHPMIPPSSAGKGFWLTALLILLAGAAPFALEREAGEDADSAEPKTSKPVVRSFGVY